MTGPILISPEVLVPRLGEQLVENGLITRDQLKLALEHQKKSKAITEQILRLRAALEDANRNLERRVQQRTAELEEALQKLSELNQLKANFLANISHELRTPLTHIRGYLELMQTESLGPLNPEQDKAIDVSLHSAARLQNLIDDLILFSQASRGEMTLTLAPVDFKKVVNRVVTHARPKAEDRGVALKVALDPAVASVQADEEKISWVLTQLLDNAIKFTPAGGQVQLMARLDEQNRHLVQVSVSDTGVGIPQERLAEIFEPFHQLDSSSTRRYGGTGLGLALVREIIEAHSSMISVQSVLQQGTTISFPLINQRE